MLSNQGINLIHNYQKNIYFFLFFISFANLLIAIIYLLLPLNYYTIQFQIKTITNSNLIFSRNFFYQDLLKLFNQKCLSDSSIPINLFMSQFKLHIKSYLELTKQFKNESRNILIFFWAEWCSPCKTMKLKIQRILEQKEKFHLILVNTEDCQLQLLNKYEVMSIPRLLLCKGSPECVTDILIGLDQNKLKNMVYKIKMINKE